MSYPVSSIQSRFNFQWGTGGFPLLVGLRNTPWPSATFYASCADGDAEDHILNPEVSEFFHGAQGCGIYSLKDAPIVSDTGSAHLYAVARCVNEGLVAEAKAGYRATRVTLQQVWVITTNIRLDDVEYVNWVAAGLRLRYNMPVVVVSYGEWKVIAGYPAPPQVDLAALSASLTETAAELRADLATGKAVGKRV